MNDDPSRKTRRPCRTDDRRRRFEAMLREAREEADRDGDVTVEEVPAEMDEIIAASEKK